MHARRPCVLTPCYFAIHVAAVVEREGLGSNKCKRVVVGVCRRRAPAGWAGLFGSSAKARDRLRMMNGRFGVSGRHMIGAPRAGRVCGRQTQCAQASAAPPGTSQRTTRMFTSRFQAPVGRPPAQEPGMPPSAPQRAQRPPVVQELAQARLLRANSAFKTAW